MKFLLQDPSRRENKQFGFISKILEKYFIIYRRNFLRDIANFLDCIRYGNVPNCDVEIGHKSTLWVQLGNIAQRVGHTLNIDQDNGRILGDMEAMKLWSREYEPGWEPKI